jgi:tRNA(His) 5'-end guanylyltransferase
MQFDELDKRMRLFETAHDHCVLPGIWMVARLDGRSFTRLTRELQHFAAPFDERFRDLMVATTGHLMTSGFNVLYGYTESDEISLLLHKNEDAFDRKLRKLISVLAGEASAAFSLKLGAQACFDCRISQLPSEELVIDYFRWRSEDAHRNALNAHCYWLLRKEGTSPRAAASRLDGLSATEKRELLFAHGVDFDGVPRWQKRGVGLYWETYIKEGRNPLTGETALAERRRIRSEYELPSKEEYDAFLRERLASA